MNKFDATQFRIKTEPRSADRVASLTPLLRLSFPGPFEAEVVEQIKQDSCRQMSAVLVRETADSAAEIIGQAFYAAITIEGSTAADGYSLGPVAIHPDWQKRGFGLKLLQESLQTLASESQAGWVVVLGEPQLYLKAGFVPASKFGLKCRYPVNAEYFMALELRPDALKELHGFVDYHPAFGDPDELPVEPH